MPGTETAETKGIKGGRPTVEERATAPVGASAGPGTTAEGAAPSAPPAPKTDPDIEKLGLADDAKKAAYELKKKHPTVVFTSGKRGTKRKQAVAMASEIVKNPKYITDVAKYTYKGAKELQKWVDDNPKASESEIANGLEEIMATWTDDQMGLLSRHYVGMAFDVQSVTENAEQIRATMSSLGKFLDEIIGKDKEGKDIVVWHVQF